MALFGAGGTDGYGDNIEQLVQLGTLYPWVLKSRKSLAKLRQVTRQPSSSAVAVITPYLDAFALYTSLSPT